MGLTEIREGLAANLACIPGLSEHAYLLSNPTPPRAEIEPGPIDYDRAFGRGMDEWTLIVRVEVALTSDIGGQKRLDLMLAPSGVFSVKEALESDTTLAGACDDLRVTSCTGYRTFVREGKPSTLGAEWTVQVIAAGD